MQGSIVRVPFNPTQNSYTKTRALTFEAWVKPMHSDARGAILNKAIGDCKDDWVLALGDQMTPRFLCANSCTGNNRIVELRRGIDIEKWHHLAGVWDGDTIRLFVDGRQVRRAFCDETPSANEIDMSIGASNHWDGNHLGFRGWIDEVRFSNVARYRDNFIPAMRHQNDEHTVLLFHFDEGEGAKVQDSSNSNLTAYAKNILWSPDSPMASEPLVTGKENNSQTDVPRTALAIALAVVFTLGFFVWYRRRFAVIPSKVDTKLPSSTERIAQVRSSIRLLGHFQAIDLQGNDVTSEFSPKIREYFLFVLIHSVASGSSIRGVSSQKLTLALWPNFDKESAKNSRNVTATKLRKLLTSIGDIQIVNTGSSVRIDLGKTVSCDLNDLTESLQGAGMASEENANKLAGLASRGELLEDQDYDWLDPLRVDLRERVIKACLSQLMTNSHGLDPELALRISSATLVWDNLHEQSMVNKVQSLGDLGRPSQARETYEKYVREYEETTGKPYGKSFEEVVR
ncbi:MAG: LamG-like jellyroll fold domain-containing protein [Bacteroidota bacterium]